jgi:hypothetical protein
MRRRIRLLASLAGLALLATAAPAWSQTLPGTPVPISPPPAGGALVPAGPPPVGLGTPLPVPASPPPSAPPAPIFVPPPLPPAAPPPTPAIELAPLGFSGCEVPFFAVEFDVLQPTVNNKLHNIIVHSDGTVDAINVPRTDLDWTVAPSFIAGLRLPDNQGELSVGYRFIAAQGDGSTTIEGVDFSTRSRLNVNIFDLDYATARWEPFPRWDMQLRVGARLGSFFYDSNISNDALLVSASNYYIGGGPHFGVDVHRCIVLVPGLAAYGRLDGTVLVGQISQKFAEQFNFPDGTVARGENDFTKTQTVPGLTAQLGLSYTPPRFEYLHFVAGYQFERWWQLGRAEGSNLELTTQGFFLRSQVDF